MNLAILFEVDLEPGKLFNGDLLEEALFVSLLETLDVGGLDLGTRWLLTAPWEDDGCLSTSAAAGAFGFFDFTADFRVVLATEYFFPVGLENDVCLVIFDCFCLSLVVFFFFIAVLVGDGCLDLDLLTDNRLCAGLWIKFRVFEVDFDCGCFCPILLAKNCFLVEGDLFAASWEDNECLDVDLEGEDFSNLDARDWFGKTDEDDFG